MAWVLGMKTTDSVGLTFGMRGSGSETTALSLRLKQVCTPEFVAQYGVNPSKTLGSVLYLRPIVPLLSP